MNTSYSISGIIVFAVAALLLSGCTRYSPSPRRGMPKEFSLVYQEIYGHCYDSVPYAVVALDLYSDSLTLDKKHKMQGTGYNLYISDIFVSDSLLTPGEYHSIPITHLQSPISPNTFLPGHDWDGTPTGMYLLYVEKDQLQSIQLLDSGSFVVRDTTNGLIDLQFTLHYKNAYGYKATYTTHFQGDLIPWRKK